MHIPNVFLWIRLKPFSTKCQFLIVLLRVIIGVCRLPTIKLMYIYVIVFRSMYAKQLFSGDIRRRLNHTAREQLVCLICMHNSWNIYAKELLFLAMSLD